MTTTQQVLERAESAIALAFEGEGEAWSDKLSGDRLARVARDAIEPIIERSYSPYHVDLEPELATLMRSIYDGYHADKDGLIAEGEPGLVWATVTDVAGEVVRAGIALSGYRQYIPSDPPDFHNLGDIAAHILAPLTYRLVVKFAGDDEAFEWRTDEHTYTLTLTKEKR